MKKKIFYLLVSVILALCILDAAYAVYAITEFIPVVTEGAFIGLGFFVFSVCTAAVNACGLIFVAVYALILKLYKKSKPRPASSEVEQINSNG